jgi:hypothetical protein
METPSLEREGASVSRGFMTHGIPIQLPDLVAILDRCPNVVIMRLDCNIASGSLLATELGALAPNLEVHNLRPTAALITAGPHADEKVYETLSPILAVLPYLRVLLVAECSDIPGECADIHGNSFAGISGGESSRPIAISIHRLRTTS